MEFEYAHSNTTAKLPILKLGEYEMWVIRIKQYFQDLEQIHGDDLEAIDLKWRFSLLSMRAKRYYQRTGKKIFINANDTDGYDKSKCDDLIVKLNQTEFTAATYKRGLATVEEQLITYRKNEVLFSEEVAVLKREVACKDYEINVLKSEFEKVKQEKEGIEFKIEKFDKASKDLDKLLGSQITDKSKKGLGYSAVPPPHPLIYNRPKKLDLSYSGLDEFKEPEFKAYGSEDKQVSKDTSSFVESSLNVDKETIFPVDKKVEFVKPKNHEKPVKKSVRVNYNYTTKRTHPNAQRNMVPRAILMKTGLRTFNTSRIVNTAHPKSIVFSAKFNTARPKAVKTARPNFAVVNAVRVNQANAVKASACWVWRPTKPNSASITLKKHNYIDARGRSKASHNRMTQDLLTEDEESKTSRHVKRGRDTKIPQSSGPPIKVGVEVVHKELGDKMERAATTASTDEGVTAAKMDEFAPTSAPTTVIDELTLAQTLIEIKVAKPKAVTTATTTTTTRPKARGVVVQEPSEFKTTTSSPQASQPSKTKDKGKPIMSEPGVPLKRKDQVTLDEEMARNLKAQLQAELIEEEKTARKKEEEANITLIESWKNRQAMMEADRLLVERLQTREQEELTDEEKAKLFMEFMKNRRKHFATLRAQENRNKPPTKAQKRNQISIYLKHMGGYKHNQLKGKSYDEIQKLFDKEMKRVNSFVAMNSEV
ncbi:hypothetical protein Tco_0018732 [Tanacetum coccineum]